MSKQAGKVSLTLIRACSAKTRPLPLRAYKKIIKHGNRSIAVNTLD